MQIPDSPSFDSPPAAGIGMTKPVPPDPAPPEAPLPAMPALPDSEYDPCPSSPLNWTSPANELPPFPPGVLAAVPGDILLPPPP